MIKNIEKYKNIFSLLKIIIFITITVWCINKLGWLMRPTNTDEAFCAIKTFHNMPENTFEVIGYGSSHIWKGLNAMQMYKDYGIGAYNYGCNWQHINTTLLFLADSLRTQSPKIVLIETYKVNELLINQDLNGEIYYTKEIANSPNKKDYIRQVCGNDIEKYLSYYFPVVSFHSNWNKIAQSNFNKNYNKYDFKKSMGYLAGNKVTSIDLSKNSSREEKALSIEAIKALNEITKICKDKNISILYYTAPYGVKYNYSNAMKEYASKTGASYIDLNEKIDELKIDPKTDFQDAGHLNDIGTTKLSNYIGKYLVENYELTDMRKIENNIWQQNL